MKNFSKHYQKRIAELKAENARLKAEVERLTAFTTRTIIPNEELQAQVERLKRGGDGIIKTACRYLSPFHAPQVLREWHETKEGKVQP